MIQSLLDESTPQIEWFDATYDLKIQDSELRSVFIDMMTICRLLNDDGFKPRLDPYAFQEILISVCYRLLHHAPLDGGTNMNENDNACHLGILALMVTLLFHNGRSRRILYNLLADMLRNAIENISRNQTMPVEVILWLLFVGGISVFDVTDRPWVISQMKACLFALDIDSWPAAREVIRKLPWVDIFHEEIGQSLWKAVVWG
jgi:hypothetical protein